MRKHKRILAFVLMLCMVFTMLTGCKKDDSTFFSITKEAAAFESYTYVGSGEFTMYAETINFEVSGKVNGGDWTLGARLWTEDEEINLAETLVYVDNSLYVNLDEILGTVSSFVIGVNFRSVLEDMYGIPVGWYELPMPEGYFDLNSDIYKEYSKFGLMFLEEMLNGIEIKKEKSNFTVEINEPKEFSVMLDNLATSVENHKPEFKEFLSGDYINYMKDALVELLDLYGNSIINVMERLNEERSLGYGEEEFQQARASFQDAIDSAKEEVEELTIEEIQAEMEEGFTGIVAELREAAVAMKEYDMGENTVSVKVSNSMEGKTGKKEYNLKVEVEAVSSEESASGIVELTMKQENVEITVPENAYSFEDWLYNILATVYEMTDY